MQSGATLETVSWEEDDDDVEHVKQEFLPQSRHEILVLDLNLPNFILIGWTFKRLNGTRVAKLSRANPAGAIRSIHRAENIDFCRRLQQRWTRCR